MLSYSLTIFLGAFLLFQVQPLIGKYILPWFGGGPGVWTTCMLFFQLLLLAGYAYAHGITRWLKPRKQILAHLVLLAAALALLPIVPTDAWKPLGRENPAVRILLLLTATLGLPYFILSATGPLLQRWFCTTHDNAPPYRLYALSNAGSLLALISYPFFFEPHFSRKTQAMMWGWGLAAYALGCAACAWNVWKHPASNEQSSNANLEDSTHQTGPLMPVFWLLWPACSASLLLAITNKICQDVAVVPFLWVLPLAIYLLSFVLCFASSRWYAPLPFALALVAALGVICWVLVKGTGLSIRIQLAGYSAGLFVCCLVCHGELYRLKPNPRRLTEYYLMIAAGGALGGLAVAVLAPLLFTSYYELHYGLLLCAILFALARSLPTGSTARDGPATEISKMMVPTVPPGQWRLLACVLTLVVFAAIDVSLAHLARHAQTSGKALIIDLRIGVWIALVLLVVSWIARRKIHTFLYWKFLACAWLWLGVLALAATLWVQGRRNDPDIIYTSRNFYGVLTIFEHQRDKPLDHHFLLQHGRITHGLQFVEPEQATWPTTYYGEQSGLGLAMRAFPSPRRLGIVGLGAGTIATYAQPGDYVRIYEINPEVTRLATSRFTYVKNCPGRVEVATGDARLSMEREQPQLFDLLALDAFSSDAIPVHLLTREAFEVYQKHLSPHGIIAIHISNQYLDLEPVVTSMAHYFHYQLATIDYDEFEADWWLYSNTWMLLTRDEALLQAPAIHWATTPPRTNTISVPLWTDDFTSLFPILK